LVSQPSYPAKKEKNKREGVLIRI